MFLSLHNPVYYLSLGSLKVPHRFALRTVFLLDAQAHVAWEPHGVEPLCSFQVRPSYPQIMEKKVEREMEMDLH